MSQKRVIEQIRKNKRFLITSHINLEGDALGSQLAMRALLLYLDKNAVIVDEDKIPEEYKFLPGLKCIKRPKDVKDFKFDALIVLDCSDPGRCKEVIKLFSRDKMIINIDHHISNNKFADINWVDHRASSTAQMVYELYKNMRVPFNRNKALWLYVGLLTDTGSFRYPNTTSLSHRAACELMQYNLAVNEIYRDIYDNLSFSDMKLLIKVLSTSRQGANGRIIWFEIKRKLLSRKRTSFDIAEHVLNFGRLNKDAEVIVLFKEDMNRADQIHLNLRSKGKVDVNRIARFFYGGGHKNASGCTIKGKLTDVKKMVLQKIKEFIT